MFVLFPIAVFLLAAIAFAMGLEALAVYVGALLAVWLLFAYALPMLTGVMTPGEVLTGVRSCRRNSTHFEGEPLPERNAWPDALGNPGDAD
jgi:hypothetical protein